MKEIRAQAATEYLMSYGWAFLIIAVVAAILIASGVFSSKPPSLITLLNNPQSLSVSAGCTVNGIVYEISNPTSFPITLTDFYLYTGGSEVFNQTDLYYLSPGTSIAFLFHYQCKPNTQYTAYQNYIYNSLPETLSFSFSSPLEKVPSNTLKIVISNPYNFYIPNSSASYYQQPIVINTSLISSYTNNMENYYFTYPNGSLVYSFYEGNYIAPQSRPTGIAFSPNGKLIYVANEGTNNIAVINASDFKLIGEISAPGNPFSIVATNKYLFYSAFSNNSFDVINLSNDQLVYSYSIGIMPTVMIEYKNELIVASDSWNALYAFNASYPFNEIRTYGPYRPWSETVVNNTNRLFTDSFINTCLYQEFNLSTGSGIASFDCNGYASKDVYAYQNFVFATVPTLQEIAIFNVLNNQTTYVSTPGVPNYVTVDPQKSLVLVTVYPNKLAIFNYTGSSLTFWRSIGVGLAPSMLAVSPSGNYVVVSGKTSNYISIINLTSLNVTNLYTNPITVNQQVFWLKLPALAPHSNITVFLNFLPKEFISLNGVQVGAAPQYTYPYNYSNIQYIMNKGLIYNWYIDFLQGFTYPSQTALDNASLFNGTKFTQPGINTYEVAYSNPNISLYYGIRNRVFGFINGYENYTEFSFQYYYANPSTWVCNATNPYPCPPFHAEGNQAQNFSWSMKAIGFIQANSSTLAYSDTDDGVGAGYLPASNTTVLTGHDWLGPINPNNILASWGGNSGTEYIGVIPYGVWPFEFDYCEGTGQALTTFWTQNIVYYYHPDLLNETPIVYIT